MERYLKESAMLDFTAMSLQNLILMQGWKALNDEDKIQSIMPVFMMRFVLATMSAMKFLRHRF